MGTFNIKDFGAVGDGAADDTAAIQRAIDACSDSGGGRVVLPGGFRCYSGSIRLRSHVDLHLESGAVLKASGNPNDYAGPVRYEDDGPQEYGGRPLRAFLYARGEENVTLSGRGSIDGNAEAFAGEGDRYHIAGGTYPRPALCFFEDCRHLTIADITLRNAPFWTLHPAGCDDVLISHIRILNPLNMANCDGIDPDHCRNVRIIGCHIEAADDCIVLKNTRALQRYGPTENVVITGCTLVSTSAAVKIGTESVSDFRNIVVSSSVISRSNRGLSIQLRDEGNVENVLFSDLIIQTRRFHEQWWGKAEPIYVTALNRNPQTTVGRVRNVRFRNISCEGESGVYIRGQSEDSIRSLVLEGVRLQIAKMSKWPGGWYDERPCEGSGLIEREIAGIYCANATDVTLRYVDVVWEGNLPSYYGPALEVHHVSGLKQEGFRGEAAPMRHSE